MRNLLTIAAIGIALGVALAVATARAQATAPAPDKPAAAGAAAVSKDGATAAKPDTEIKLVNPSFEEPANGPRAPGWIPSQHWGPTRNYEWSVDTQTATDGKASYRIKRTSPQAFGMVKQGLSIQQYAGKTLEFSAMLKTDGVGPEGWLIVVDVESRTATLEQLRSPPVTGKQDWKRHAVRFKLPADAAELKLGIMLLDEGTGWVDDAKLRIVD